MASLLVLRVRADIDLSKRWSWDLITYRFRDAINAENDYNTPEVSSAIALKIDDRRSNLRKVLLRLERRQSRQPRNRSVSSITADAKRRSLAQRPSLTSR